jgi:hypothetical protein
MEDFDDGSSDWNSCFCPRRYSSFSLILFHIVYWETHYIIVNDGFFAVITSSSVAVFFTKFDIVFDWMKKKSILWNNTILFLKSNKFNVLISYCQSIVVLLRCIIYRREMSDKIVDFQNQFSKIANVSLY